MALLTEQVVLWRACPHFSLRPGSLSSQTCPSASLFLRLLAKCCSSQGHHSFEALHSTTAFLVQAVCSSFVVLVAPTVADLILQVEAILADRLHLTWGCTPAAPAAIRAL